MKDIAALTPSNGSAPPPMRVVDAAFPADAIQIALTWRQALGRKATDADLLDEPVPFRNQICYGATLWLDAYKGDFDYLLQLQQSKRYVGRGQQFPSYRQAAGILNCMAAEARRNAPQPANGAPAALAPVARLQVEDAGVYVLPDGTVCRVQANREKTKTYAKRWVPVKHLDRLMEAGQHEHGDYVYEAGLVDVVARTGRKMTLEEAKAHSIRYGRCVRCGRQLTDGKSVEQGMGPICIQYFS